MGTLRNTLITFATVIALVGGAIFTTFSQPGVAPLVPGSIHGPEQARIGELVQLAISGREVEWTVLPQVPFITYDENMVLSFCDAGKYTVIAAVSDPITIHTLEIQVGGPPVVHPELDDVVQPTPTPEVVPLPIGLNESVSNNLQQWASEHKVPVDIAEKVAGTFTFVADEIAQKKILTPNGVIRRTANLNQDLPLQPYTTILTNIQTMLNDLSSKGKLKTMQQHETVWRSMAHGLNRYTTKG